MAELTEEELERLFQLARLAYTEEERQSALRGIAKILKYVERLSAVPTDDVPPCVFAVAVTNMGREDTLNNPHFPPMSRDEFLKASPSHTAGMVRVPPTISF